MDDVHDQSAASSRNVWRHGDTHGPRKRFNPDWRLQTRQQVEKRAGCRKERSTWETPHTIHFWSSYDETTGQDQLNHDATTSTLTPGRSKIVFDFILETDPLSLRVVVTIKELLVVLVSCFYAGKMSTITQIHVFIHSTANEALLLMNLDQKKNQVGSSSRLSIIQMFGMNEMKCSACKTNRQLASHLP